MKPDMEQMETPVAVAAEGVEALCTPDPELAKKEVALCSICLQWTCEGPHCHREGVCEDEAA